MLDPEVNRNIQQRSLEERSLEDLKFDHILSRFFKSATTIAESLDLLTFKLVDTTCQIALKNDIVADDRLELIELIQELHEKANLKNKSLPFKLCNNFQILLANACNEYNQLINGSKTDTHKNFYDQIVKPLLVDLDPDNKSNLYNKINLYNKNILEYRAIENFFSEYQLDDEIEDALDDDTNEIMEARNVLLQIWQEIAELTKEDSPLFLVHKIAEISSTVYKSYMQFLYTQTEEFAADSEDCDVDLNNSLTANDDSDTLSEDEEDQVERAEEVVQKIVINGKKFVRNTFALLRIEKFSENIVVIEFDENGTDLLEVDKNELIRQVYNSALELLTTEINKGSIKIEEAHNSIYIDFTSYDCPKLTEMLVYINNEAFYGATLDKMLVESFAYIKDQEKIIRVEYLHNPKQSIFNSTIAYGLSYIQDLNLNQPILNVYALENLGEFYNIRISAELPKYLKKQCQISDRNLHYLTNYSDLVFIDLPDLNQHEREAVCLYLGSPVLDSLELNKLLKKIPPLTIHAGIDVNNFWENYAEENNHSERYSAEMQRHLREQFLIEYQSLFNKGLRELMIQAENITHYGKDSNLALELSCEVRETGQLTEPIFYLEFDCLIYRESQLLQRFVIKSENIDSKISVSAVQY
jgi:hypothetical protein